MTSPFSLFLLLLLSLSSIVPSSGSNVEVEIDSFSLDLFKTPETGVSTEAIEALEDAADEILFSRLSDRYAGSPYLVDGVDVDVKSQETLGTTGNSGSRFTIAGTILFDTSKPVPPPRQANISLKHVIEASLGDGTLMNQIKQSHDDFSEMETIEVDVTAVPTMSPTSSPTSAPSSAPTPEATLSNNSSSSATAKGVVQGEEDDVGDGTIESGTNTQVGAIVAPIVIGVLGLFTFFVIRSRQTGETPTRQALNDDDDFSQQSNDEATIEFGGDAASQSNNTESQKDDNVDGHPLCFVSQSQSLLAENCTLMECGDISEQVKQAINDEKNNSQVTQEHL